MNPDYIDEEDAPGEIDPDYTNEEDGLRIVNLIKTLSARGSLNSRWTPTTSTRRMLLVLST